MPGSRGGWLSDRPGGAKLSVDVHTSMLLPELPLAAWGDRPRTVALCAGSLLILDAKMPESDRSTLRHLIRKPLWVGLFKFKTSFGRRRVHYALEARRSSLTYSALTYSALKYNVIIAGGVCPA